MNEAKQHSPMKFQEMIRRILRTMNPVIIALLRSPFHSLVSGSFMLIVFKGQKTGKSYITPVSFIHEDGVIYSFTHNMWWKNLRGGARVSLWLRGREVEGFAEPVSDDRQRIAEGLRQFLRHLPRSAGFYKVTLDQNRQPNAEDLLRAAQDTTMLQIRLAES